LLKRAIARGMFKHLTAPCPIDDYSDLRPIRLARNRLEPGLKRNDTLAANYRQWLNTQLIHAA
jgi:transposase